MSREADALLAAIWAVMAFLAVLVIRQPWCWSLMVLGFVLLAYSWHTFTYTDPDQ